MADKLTLDRQAMKDRSTSHLRIYVGSLPDNITTEDLYDHFITYGQINGIVINRNFGFVQFEEESSAQDAIAKANGTILQGKTLTVRTAQQNTDKRNTAEVVVVHPEKPPAVVLTDTHLTSNDEPSEDPYDNYGNYVGDQGYRDEEYDEGYNQNWKESRGGARGRGPARGRGWGGRGRQPNFRERSPPPVRGGEWSDRGGYDRYPQSRPDYPRALPVSERNDCEIIVVSKALTEYAEYIEGRLKRLGIVVDLLFPMEDVPIGKVLGNIASRGCLYAILVMPQNQEHRSLTLTILHGLPQEHRNMPLEDALQLISRNFQEVQRGGPSGREAVYALLGQLADGRTLTVLQYDKVIEYLQERKNQQIKIELGEPLTPAPATTKTQVDLQERILSILNDKKVSSQKEAAPTPPPVAAPQGNQSTLLKDPTVRKALDTILKKFT
ncbi:nuclear receptor coactivator 5 isoform X2 [Galleria mellonella]|uniref:Nuclear receptor coactivator 5 isoform X2 n=1 Tax=Galleria mellonella TaxID=7137 RepID=A0A6J1X7J6_GALME|nr:nuclear receptor coactivator 5 isoform X2 [Galleria mellonella]